MRKISNIIIAMLLAIYFVCSYSSNVAKATGTTYYVSPTGVDGAAGDIANPWQTLAYVNSVLDGTAGGGAPTIVAGDIIRFERDGTYNGDGADSDCALKIGIDGTAGNNIVFSDYGVGDRPKILATTDECGIGLLDGASFITIQNIDISAALTDSVSILGTVSNIAFSNMSINGRVDSGDTDYASGIHIGSGSFTSLSFSNLTESYVSHGLWAQGFTTLNGLALSNTIFNSYPSGTQNDYGVLIYNDGVSGNASNITLDNVSATQNAKCGAFLYKNNYVTIRDSSFNNNDYDGLVISESYDVSIDNITASGNGVAETAGLGAGLYFSNTENLDIANSTLSSNFLSGISSGSRNVAVNEFDVVSSSSDSFSASNITARENTINAISLAGDGENYILSNIDASDNDNDGITLHDNLKSVTIQNSLAVNNGTIGDSTTGDGYNFRDSTTGTIMNSRAFDNLKSAVNNNGSSSTTIKNNIFSSSSAGYASLILLSNNGTHSVYHNTIYGKLNQGTAVEVGDMTLLTTVNFSNNIVYGFSLGLSVRTVGGVQGNVMLTQHRNLFYNNSTHLLGVLLGDSIVADPIFYNSGAGDFSLQLSSPAIDAAADLGIDTDYNGATRQDNPCVANTGTGAVTYYDIGAIENVYTGSCSAAAGSVQSGTPGTLARTGPASMIDSILKLFKR